MDTIPIEQIMSAPDPVRKTWDEDKLNELAESIREQGLIVPIKVRPNGSSWEVIYGHRRREAALRAGLLDIPVVVEGCDDENALIQALIENVQREDMTPKDLGLAIQKLQKITGWPLREIEKRGISNYKASVEALWVIRLEPEWQDRVVKSLGGDREEGTVAVDHIVQLTPVKNLAKEEFEAILEKSAGPEKLSPAQARRIADSVAVTKDPKRRQALIETPYSAFIHDPEINRERAERFGASDPLSVPKESADDKWQASPEVKAMIDMVKDLSRNVPDIVDAIEEGKFSPEGRWYFKSAVNGLILGLQDIVFALDAMEDADEQERD